MADDSSRALIDYLREEFPGTRVEESAHRAAEWPLERCFCVKDGRNTHLLIVESMLFATLTNLEMLALLEAFDVADFLFRARGSPVSLTEDGPRVVPAP